MDRRDGQARVITRDFPGWNAWQSLDGQWHAGIAGAIPPVMVRSDSAGGLRDQIRGQAT